MDDEQRYLAWAEEQLGYRFQQAHWLVEALTHPTYAHEAGPPTRSNQRLEFLGDAVLGLAVARALFEGMNTADEGLMTRTMQGLVSAAPLARVARRLGLGQHLRLGRGEASTGGRSRLSNLSDALEALVAAVFLDGGYPAAETVVHRMMAPELAAARAGTVAENHKAALQEWTQERLGMTPVYRVVATTGPDHDRRFRVEVQVAERVLGTGEGRSKREAEQAAARMARRKLASDGSTGG